MSYDWKAVRITAYDDGGVEDRIERCDRCNARRRMIVDGDGRQEVIFSDPKPLPEACPDRQEGEPS